MTIVVILLIWFVLSVPVTLIFGRIIAGGTRHSIVPEPAPRALASGHGLVRT